jgi:hypothetical protein
MIDERIFDASGNRIDVGDRVTTGAHDEYAGTVVRLNPTDGGGPGEGHHPQVVVGYDDGTTETWSTQPKDDRYTYYVCGEVTVRLVPSLRPACPKCGGADTRRATAYWQCACGHEWQEAAR